MESVSHAGCVIGILAPGDAGTHLGKELSTVRPARFVTFYIANNKSDASYTGRKERGLVSCDGRRRRRR